jgi:N-acetylglutamate synthase-like GNAT family acetyltransferase
VKPVTPTEKYTNWFYLFYNAHTFIVEFKKWGGEMEETIRKAEKKDIKRLESFLVEANLSAEGVADTIEYYSLLETKSGALRACIGIEPVNGVGMLRSFVVSEGTSQVQILMLFDRVIRIAEGNKLKALYLATNKESAVSFFNKIGFNTVKDVPTVLYNHPHFEQVSSVDNSIIMEMKVENVDNS